MRAFEMASALSQQEANARDFEGDMSLKKKSKTQKGGSAFGAIAGILLTNSQ